jgi:hypothetical protein
MGVASCTSFMCKDFLPVVHMTCLSVVKTDQQICRLYSYVFVSVSPLRVSVVKSPSSGGTKGHTRMYLCGTNMKTQGLSYSMKYLFIINFFIIFITLIYIYFMSLLLSPFFRMRSTKINDLCIQCQPNVSTSHTFNVNFHYFIHFAVCKARFV